MTLQELKTEGDKKFRQIGAGSVSFMATREEFLGWHNQQLQLAYDLGKEEVVKIMKKGIERSLEPPFDLKKSSEKFDAEHPELKDFGGEGWC